jgi:hypothetical protein
VPRRKAAPIKMAILGGDLLVGRTLEVALEGVGFDARFLNGSLLTEDPTEPLDEELRLVIFAPRMSAKRRKAFLGHVRGTAATAGVPVLELVTASATSRNGREELVGLVA